MDAEEFLPRMEVEELLQRYAAGERDFSLLDLSGADLSKVDFAQRTFKGGIIYNHRIKFTYTNLSNANLSSANLFDAIMEFANLTNACLEGAKLDCALLEGANLKGANLRGAILGATNLAGADLTDADLTGASWGFNAKDTIFNNTILPDGTIRSEPY